MANRGPFDNLTGISALSEITRRLGGLGNQIKDAVEQAQQAAQQGAQQSGNNTGEQVFTINTPNGPVNGVSQMSFRVGSLSDRMKPAAGRGGPSAATRAERPRKAAPDIDGAREPLVDCFDEGTTFLVTAELPGVSADSITVTLEANELLIEATGQRKYRARMAMPAPVDALSLEHALRNGILEARLTKIASQS
ncbi:MAG: Hsp20/alpha crystallin family protein [Beijerinckiaceae bacterium]